MGVNDKQQYACSMHDCIDRKLQQLIEVHKYW